MANLFDILAENDLDTEQTVIPRSPPGNPKVAGSSAAVLGEISLNTIHNRTPAARDSLAEKSVEDQTPPTAAQGLSSQRRAKHFESANNMLMLHLPQNYTASSCWFLTKKRIAFHPTRNSCQNT